MTEAMAIAESRILAIDSSSPETTIIARVCEALAHGELVVSPTETRYGILGRVDNDVSLAKLFELKGRDAAKPSAVFVKDVAEISKYAIMNSTAKAIANKFLPGALTLVLPAKEDFGKLITKDGRTGFRVSSNRLIAEILEKSQVPITATSANLSGQPELMSIAEIKKCFGDEIALYLDAGKLNRPASTVVEIVEDEIKILREGAISEQEIRAALR